MHPTEDSPDPFLLKLAGAIAGVSFYLVFLAAIHFCLRQLIADEPMEFKLFFLPGIILTNIVSLLISNVPDYNFAKVLQYGLMVNASTVPFAVIGSLVGPTSRISRRNAFILLTFSALLSIPGLCVITQGLMFVLLPYGIDGSYYSHDQTLIMSPFFLAGGSVLSLIPLATGHLLFKTRSGIPEKLKTRFSIPKPMLVWGTLITTIVFFSLANWFLYKELEGLRRYEDKTLATTAAERLLLVAAKHPTGNLPKQELSATLWIGQACWIFLRDSMAKNSVYRLNVETSDAADIEIGLYFPDTSQAYLTFHEGQIISCHIPGSLK